MSTPTAMNTKIRSEPPRLDRSMTNSLSTREAEQARAQHPCRAQAAPVRAHHQAQGQQRPQDRVAGLHQERGEQTAAVPRDAGVVMDHPQPDRIDGDETDGSQRQQPARIARRGRHRQLALADACEPDGAGAQAKRDRQVRGVEQRNVGQRLGIAVRVHGDQQAGQRDGESSAERPPATGRRGHSGPRARGRPRALPRTRRAATTAARPRWQTPAGSPWPRRSATAGPRRLRTPGGCRPAGPATRLRRHAPTATSLEAAPRPAGAASRHAWPAPAARRSSPRTGTRGSGLPRR